MPSAKLPCGLNPKRYWTHNMHFVYFKKLFTVGLLFAAVSCLAAPKEQAVTLTTQDGWKLAAVYRPADNNTWPTAILLHDLGKSKAVFSSLEQALAKAGMGYLAVDLRGHGQSVGGGNYKSFAKEGPDNPFNKMGRDVQAAVAFLKTKGISNQNMVLIGAGLGANVAAKTVGLLPDIFGIALFSPNVNIRDVLAVPALKLYKGNVLIAASADERKGFLEASILRNVAFLSAGEGKVTFLTAYDSASHEMLDKYFISTLVQWIRTPQRPAVRPDMPLASADVTVDTDGLPVAPSYTEQALVPSILME